MLGHWFRFQKIKQNEIADEVLNKELSVRQTEKVVKIKRALRGSSTAYNEANIRMLMQTLSI